MKVSNIEMNPLHAVSPDDAIGMLIADHKRVAALFAEFKALGDEGSDRRKSDLVAQICRELTVHTQLEEELFYPAVRKATEDDDQVDEAIVEHAGAKHLIAQLAGAGPNDDLYDAKVTVLGEQIDHHVEEEEGSLFPKARYSGIDTLELGAAMRARKAELMSGAAPEARAAPPQATAGKRAIDAVKGTERPKKGRPSVKKKAAKQKNVSKRQRR